LEDTFQDYFKSGSLKCPDPSQKLQSMTVQNLEEQKTSLVSILKLLDKKKEREGQKKKK